MEHYKISKLLNDSTTNKNSIYSTNKKITFKNFNVKIRFMWL